MIHGRELSDKSFQLNSLDGLRGFAVLIVFLSHTSSNGFGLFPFIDFSGAGKSGVFLFFVLSSFLLTLPFLKKGDAAINKEFLLNYSFRRFFRVYPLYILYLLLAFVTSVTLWKIFKLAQPVGIPFTLSFKEFLEHLALIQGKGVTWSILVEFRYYFILPVLALTYSVILKNKIIPSILLTLVLIISSQMIWPESESLKNDSRLGPYLPIFFIGSFLAVVFHKWNESSLKNSKKMLYGLEFLGLVAIFILLFMIPSVSSIFIEEVPYDYYHKQFIIHGLLWSIVIFSCIAGTGAVRTVFEISFLRYLGFISFSAYLLHVLAIIFVKQLNAGELPMQGWLVFVITILISHVSWLTIEKPTSKIRLIK